MKNKFGVFLTYFFEIMLIVGCSQIQPTKTAIAIPKQTNKPLPEATLTSIPTSTPLPTFTPFPTIPPPPLPKGVFDTFQESIYQPASVQKITHRIIKTAFGVISSGTTIEENILVDSTMSDAVFSLFWEEGDLDLILIQPDGSIIDPSTAKSVLDFHSPLATNEHIFTISDSVRERYYIIVPQSGIWTMKISGKSTPVAGSNYMIQVTSMTAMSFYNIIEPNDATDSNDVIEFVALQRTEHFSSEPLALTFGITDGVSGSLLTGPEYIHGVSMNITVEDPEKMQYSFKLYDDGLHKDGKADDGVYANTFTNTSLIGAYNFHLQISGKNNRAKEPFVREYFFSIEVK